MLTTFTTGFFTGLALIAAIGAQSAFVLRQGVRREHVGLVVSLCIVFDIALISLGVAGVGAFVSGNSTLLNVLTYGGAAYLLYFAYGSFRSAMKPAALNIANGTSGEGTARTNPGRSVRGVVVATTAVTLLNPHVYLDAVFMIGNLANQYGMDGRWIYGIGAITASGLWNMCLGFGAKRMAPSLAKPSVWRGIDAAVGVLMISIAYKLLTGH